MKICLVALLPNRRRVETLPIERKQKGLITRDLPSVHCIFWGQRPPQPMLKWTLGSPIGDVCGGLVAAKLAR